MGYSRWEGELDQSTKSALGVSEVFNISEQACQ